MNHLEAEAFQAAASPHIMVQPSGQDPVAGEVRADVAGESKAVSFVYS